MTPAGVVTTLAGQASAGTNDGTGNAARFDIPVGVAVDSSNNVYVSDFFNYTIRKVTPAEVVTTLAGLAGVSGTNDGTGSTARFNYPEGVAVDSSNNVYVADIDNDTIRKVTPAGLVTTLAGLAGNQGSADGTGSAAQFNNPSGVAVDGAGNVYVTEIYNDTIRKVTPAGVVTTLAGLAGNQGSADGPGSAARLYSPTGLAMDSAGNLYVADSNNHTIRKGIPDYGQPIIYGQPQSQAVSASATVTLSVTNTGALPLAYQWLFNGTNLNGATSKTLNIASFQATNAGSYLVVITNVYGSATSSVAVLNLAATNQPPVVAITSPTTGATFTAPVNISISASASDPDGTVAQVVFLNGANPLGTVTHSPYTVVWTNAPV